MIILDTSAVSELMRPEPAARVAGWVRSRDRRELCMTRGATLATRNLPDFDGAGIETIDPWAPDTA